MEQKIISRLWSCICDLLILVHGNGGKSLDEIERELDGVEYLCRELYGMWDE